jgi:hypothetical protein
MTLPASVELLSKAVAIVTRKQPELFDLKVGERAISAQIGWALESLVRQTAELGLWSVDIEYDREGLEGELKRRYDQVETIPQHQSSPGLKPAFKLGVPDVVVHHRGPQGPEDNLLIVEIKRTHRIFAKNSIDRRKVDEFMGRHGYQYGCLLGLGPTVGICQPRISWRRLTDATWSPCADISCDCPQRLGDRNR